MKLIGIMASSRRDGNTNDLLEIALRAAEEEGASTEKLVLLDYNIHHILNCKDCKQQGFCPADDFPYIRDKLAEADGILWATPLYWYTVSGLLKVLLDRLSCVMYWDSPQHLLQILKGKPTGLIITREELEPEKIEHLIGTMEMVFSYAYCQMVNLGVVAGPGGSRGTALQDEVAVDAARALGKKFLEFNRLKE